MTSQKAAVTSRTAGVNAPGSDGDSPRRTCPDAGTEPPTATSPSGARASFSPLGGSLAPPGD